MLAPIALSVGLLVWSFVANLVFGEHLYVVRNVVIALLLVGLARAAGHTWRDLGFGRANIGPGLWWGAGAAVVVLIVVVLGALFGDALPLVRDLLADERADLDRSALAWNVAVRIPIGTAVFEEVAFRGVLLASFLAVTSTGWAIGWSSLVFGLWHVAPTIVALRINEVAPASAAGLRAIVGGVIVTAFAGIAFAGLRLLSGSLVAPILGHWATNALGLLAAAFTGDNVPETGEA